MDIEYMIQIVIKALLKQEEFLLDTVIPRGGIGRPQLLSECDEKHSKRKLRRKNRTKSISVKYGN